MFIPSFDSLDNGINKDLYTRSRLAKLCADVKDISFHCVDTDGQNNSVETVGKRDGFVSKKRP